MFGEHIMPKFNKYLVASLLLACFIVACGGGGGGSGGNSADSNNPSVNPPIESNPVESNPVESASPATLIISTPSLSSSNTVIAGQSFTITVKSSNGATGTLKFSNSKNTPGSITYSPATCQLSSDGSCTTQVNIGLTTPATTETAFYTTDISLENGNVENPHSSVEYKVTTPKLTVIKEPQSIIVGFSTSVGFSINQASIPDGTGNLTLHMQISGGFADLIKLAENECKLTYQDHKVIENGCSNISVTAPGPLSGQAVITASAQNFISVNSIPVDIEPGTSPSINITSSLGAGSPPNITAGHSFTLTATSINGGSGTVSFGATDPGIHFDKTTCTVDAGKFCQVIATVTLGTPPNQHDIIIDYRSGVANLPLTKYRFKSETPVLEVTNQPNVSSLREGSMITASFSIPTSSIPEGSGKITIDLKSSVEGTLAGTKSCDIVYSSGQKIVDNKCNNLQFFAQHIGVSTITASTYGFTSASLIPIVVPNKIVYVLGQTEIKMFGELSDGSLIAINNTHAISTNGNPAQMVISPDGRFLYVIDKVANIVVPYAINADTGLPTAQSNMVVATGQLPNSIVISSDGKFAHIVNTNSNNISEYTINTTTGAFIPNKTPTVSVGKQPYAMVVSPNGLNAYVSNPSLNSVTSYSIGQGFGYLKSPLALTPKNLYRSPTNLAIGPTGKDILIQNVARIDLYSPASESDRSKGSYYTVSYPNVSFNGVYYNPVISENGSEFSYAAATTRVIKYIVTSNGEWDYLGDITWSPELNGPNTMGFDSNGKYAFIGHQNAKKISMYEIQINSNGAFISKGTVDSAIAPLGIVVSPN